MKSKLQRKYEEAAELVCIAHDYLIQHWDMDSAPLYKIKNFTIEYLKTQEDTMPGKLLLRIDRNLHQRISSMAKKDGVSLNKWINEKLKGTTP